MWDKITGAICIAFLVLLWPTLAFGFSWMVDLISVVTIAFIIAALIETFRKRHEILSFQMPDRAEMKKMSFFVVGFIVYSIPWFIYIVTAGGRGTA